MMVLIRSRESKSGARCPLKGEMTLTAEVPTTDHQEVSETPSGISGLPFDLPALGTTTKTGFSAGADLPVGR